MYWVCVFYVQGFSKNSCMDFLYSSSPTLSQYFLALDHGPYDLDKWYHSQADLTNVCIGHRIEIIVVIYIISSILGSIIVKALYKHSCDHITH